MKYRIFVSIDIPDELKDIIEVHLEGFYKNDLVRVTARENQHITIVFCGYLDEEKLNKLKEVTQKIASKTKSFELIPDKIIFAPPKRTPRMVWLTFKSSQEFSKISKLFSEFSHQTRESFPHLTLVRFKEKHYSNLKPLLPLDGLNLKDETNRFIVKQINIMESHVSRNGAKYELVENFNLS